MKNKNKILLGLLVFVLSCMVGYALFSETITVTGTATASGSFSLKVTCQRGILSKIGTVQSLGLKAEGGYKNDACSVVGNNVSVSAEFLYPTSGRYFTIKATNNGTMDAKYIESEITTTDKICVTNVELGNKKECRTLTNADSSIELGVYHANLARNKLAAEDPNGNLLSEEEILQFYDPVNGIIVLKPGYSIYWYAFLWIDHLYPKYEVKPGDMFVEYESTFTIPFTQATN